MKLIKRLLGPTPKSNGELSNIALIQIHEEEKLLSTLRCLLRKRARKDMKELIQPPTWENLIPFLYQAYIFWDGLPHIVRRRLKSGQKLMDPKNNLQDVDLNFLRQRFDSITPTNIFDEKFLNEWASIIQADNDVDKMKLSELLQYLKSASIAVQKKAQEIVVNGLFLHKENIEHDNEDNPVQGCVKDVILEIFHKQNEEEQPFEIHFEVQVGKEQEIQQSIKNAKEAAFQLLNALAIGSEECLEDEIPYHPDKYGILIYLEDYPGSISKEFDDTIEAKGLEGESLGLAIALGILHRFLGHHPQTENFAATGEIDEKGNISTLNPDGIRKKVYAACTRKIPKVIVPARNQKTAEDAKNEAVQAGLIKENGVQIIGVSTLLEAACAAFELNVTFFHCNHALIREQTSSEIPYLQELEGCCGPRIILHPYSVESNQVAKKIAAQCAKRWLYANPEERNRIPSPVILNAWQSDISPVDATANALRIACSESLRSSFSLSQEMVQPYLGDRRFSVLIEGFNANQMTERLRDLLDGKFKPPLFTPGGILQKLLENQREQNVILVCCESMASWIKKENKVLASYFSDMVSRCYEGRSTAFDKHVDAVTKDYGRITACRYPPNISPYKDVLESERKLLPPDVFFYGRESIQKLFLDIYIQARGQPLLLYKFLKERTSQHFLILGGGNTGKSTLLLKIFHDCKREQNPLPYVPVLVPLRGELDSEESLYKLMADECRLKLDEFEFALNYTKDLLIMLDGLNESGIEHGFESIKKFARKCKDLGVPLILTSREIPKGRDARGELLSFATYGMVDLSIEQSATMLKNLFPKRAENILTALTGPSGNQEILTNPFMLTLLCRIVEKLSDEKLSNLTRTKIRQLIVQDWLEAEGGRQISPDEHQLKGTRISLNSRSRTRLGSRRLTWRERYLCHLGFLMVTDGNRIHIPYENGVNYIETIIQELHPAALDPNENRLHHEEVPEDLFDKLISGSLLKISSTIEEEKWESMVSFDHESIRDFMAAEYLAIQLLNSASLDDTLGSFISEAPRYSDLLSFTSGCLPPEQAREIVTKLLEEVGRKDPEKQRDERKEFLKCVAKCCVENRSLAPEIIDEVGKRLVEQFVYTGPVMDRRELGYLLTQLGNAHHKPEAFRQTLDGLQKLVRTGILKDPTTDPELPDDIVPEKEKRKFFYSQSIVEVLGFLGFPENGVIETLTDYFHAPDRDIRQGAHEKYPWRALEAFATLDWSDVSLRKLQEFVEKEVKKNPKNAAFGWHAIGALGHQDAVSMLQEYLKYDPQTKITDCLSDAPVLLKQIIKDLQNNNLGLREVLLDFVRYQNKAERWCPIILALLSDIKLDEILQNVPNRVADFLKCRWEAAEIIVKSDLSEKFYPLQRFLRDFKNYFFTEWADKQASILEDMARHNESPQQILKDSIKKMLSIDRTRVEEKLGDIDSLDEEAIKKKIKSCFDEGQWQETKEKGFTWSTILMLGVPFKQVTSLDELTEMLNNAQADIDRNQASGPPETYPRDILNKLKNEKEAEERQRE